jgi:hypothetical protein
MAVCVDDGVDLAIVPLPQHSRVWLAVSRLPVSTNTSPSAVRIAVTLPNR